ncbi:MAG: bacillithiol system redox-active protein YtxJ [Bacillaceae bacterium]|nr:bacillithiol system redox-active protein YtxJ [Bacillaceae bacterium]
MAQVKEIISVEEWKGMLKKSEEKPIMVLKHSTSCPISAGAYREYQSHLEDADESVMYALVKIIEFRDVSNQIEQDLGIKHESPQAILVKNGKAVWHDSHGSITAGNIREALKWV